ncbi:hypothetical protein SPRG_08706 [Saprolegnia parasitica CBS 223.65]|uniref:Amino acid transporter transmembrane domain-containing protein n=1 Tax=Saprolegnia parasitica (strain CBS 223.65) TaxID=695850 RepID=A0A067C6A4_SAPPC|nr:hypothetical protein SPRG_08706 [Saprolegnia parasitica CBS 223.65]KDO26053.1 hypothetical protein SPRG_08706 [Saprolegnia parasitica CBS 223.65]|eukprot:XP_012203338.1 hypothetical protein SPRG_08706 [Saprolegnia parasitica CBS 223.65]
MTIDTASFALRLDLIVNDSIHDDKVVAAYAAPGSYLKACVLRTVMVVVMVIIATIWKDHFSDLLDFVGASSTALSCMILPIVFYLKTFRTTLGVPEKAFAILCVLVTSALAVYVTYTTGKNLFAPSAGDSSIQFPYCPAEYQKMVYTNTTYYKH